jgi:hypothetical protein
MIKAQNISEMLGLDMQYKANKKQIYVRSREGPTNPGYNCKL